MQSEEEFDDDEDGEIDEDEFNEKLMEELLYSLYQPGCYAEGEELCLEILDELNPGWEPARLYLLLYLAAQDAQEEALEMIDELADDSLIEVLRHLAFGEGTEAEEIVYEDILACAQERGLESLVEEFLNKKEVALPRQDVSTMLKSWD
jgi:hypothetical protein